jgi:hypothetical protein
VSADRQSKRNRLEGLQTNLSNGRIGRLDEPLQTAKVQHVVRRELSKVRNRSAPGELVDINTEQPIAAKLASAIEGECSISILRNGDRFVRWPIDLGHPDVIEGFGDFGRVIRTPISVEDDRADAEGSVVSNPRRKPKGFVANHRPECDRWCHVFKCG